MKSREQLLISDTTPRTENPTSDLMGPSRQVVCIKCIGNVTRFVF